MDDAASSRRGDRRARDHRPQRSRRRPTRERAARAGRPRARQVIIGARQPVGHGAVARPHWRYHLPGNLVYDAGNLPRVNDPERGWCVRVRVRPQPAGGEQDT